MHRAALSTIDSPASQPAALRILVADDDPTSRLYLSEALRQLGNQPVDCEDGLAAIAQARQQYFDLLLLDCRMPGAGATEVLRALRADPAARSHDSPAVATSAQIDGELRQRLLQEGFSDVLSKPCTIDGLRQMTGQFAAAAADLPPAPLLDDAAALSASGDATILHALRGLLHEELVLFYQELDNLSADLPQLQERLHRLRSSCGFCGADALAQQAIALQRALRQGPPGERQMEDFRRVLLDTIDALAPSTA